MKTYLEFGMMADSLNHAVKAVEAATGIRLSRHESGYRCGEYFRAGSVGAENLILQNNYDEIEREWTKGAFRQYPFLLYVSETSRASEIVEALSGIADLLSRKDL